MHDGGRGGVSPPDGDGSPSLEEEGRALRKGRGRMAVAMIAAVVASVLGAALWIRSQQPSEYVQIGRRVNGLRAEHFDAFWGCALPRQDLRDLRNDQQLRAAIVLRAERARAYAAHVRSTCMVHLDEHEAPLEALITPADLAEPVAQLRAALAASRTSWRALLEELDRTEGALDPDARSETLSAVARAWFDYKVAHGAVNDVVRAHVNE